MKHAILVLVMMVPETAIGDDAHLLQFLLRSQGFEVGSIDGVIGPMTRSALNEALTAQGMDADVDDRLNILLKNHFAKNGELSPPNSSKRFRSFDELEESFIYATSRGDRDWNVRYKLQPPMRYMRTSSGQPRSDYFVGFGGFARGAVDLNGDGNDDWPIVVFAGSHPARGKENDCSPVDSCAPGGIPVAYINQGDGTWSVSAGWFTDPRRNPGEVSPMPPVFADFNGDGIVDMFLGGTAGSNPFRDSLYLSDHGRGHVESSTTHFDKIVPSFSHGTAAGDLDGNGWDDVVITSFWTTGSNFLCYMNQGYGFMTISGDCSVNLPGETFMSTSLTLADVNGDDAWDLVYSGDEKFNGGVGVALNDGNGKFLSGKDVSDETLGYFNTMPSIFAYDLDADGDQDIIGWVHRDFYNGGGVVIYENTGNGASWRQQIIPLVTPSPDDPQYQDELAQENGPWNIWIHTLHFEDVNDDGLTDIVLDGSNNNARSMKGSKWSMEGEVRINGRTYPRDGSVPIYGWDQVFGAAMIQKPGFEFEWQPKARFGISERKFH